MLRLAVFSVQQVAHRLTPGRIHLAPATAIVSLGTLTLTSFALFLATAWTMYGKPRLAGFELKLFAADRASLNGKFSRHCRPPLAGASMCHRPSYTKNGRDGQI